MIPENKLTAGNVNVSLWKIFTTFFKIGAFTIGGGLAMIPLIERDVVYRNKWLDTDDFVELLALSQATPGIMAMNIAVFVGYKTRGVKGSIVASLGSILPSFIIILLIAMVFTNFKDNEVVERIFKGIRPAVVALIAVPVIHLARTMKLTWITAMIPVAAVLLISVAHVSPVWTIVLAAFGGILWSYIKQNPKN
jgi:chromate transporter